MSRLKSVTAVALGALAVQAAGAHGAAASPATLALAAAHAGGSAATEVHYHGHYIYRPFVRPYYARPYAYYYAAPYNVAPSGCGWLRAKAIDTGSRYWWRRYRECLE